jgi:Putative zinc-finger
MDHNEAVRQKATEKYLLNELDSSDRDQFEEHLFDCQDCALDVRTAAMFLEQSKAMLAEQPAASPTRVAAPVPAKTGMFAWLRPALAIPVMAVLLAVVGYQNLVTYPQLKEAANTPQIVPWASIHTSTRGASTTQIVTRPGEGFHLLVNVPPESTYSSYTFHLSSPSGKLEWSRTVAATAADDTRSVYVPGTSQEAGIYTLAVNGTTTTGELANLGSYSIEVKIQQ